jgi:hypothetical protein
MHFAGAVQVSYSGQHHQTIVFAETDTTEQENNLAAARALLGHASSTGQAEHVRNNLVFHDVDPKAIRAFLHQYKIHPKQYNLRTSNVLGWLDKVAPESRWNVAVATRSNDAFGDEDLGLDERVNTISRAPLASSPVGEANIKGLITRGDQVDDLGDEAYSAVQAGDDFRAIRSDLADGRGLLTIYPISAASVPRQTQSLANSRRKMQSEQTLIGVGIVFPEIYGVDALDDGNFFAVTPDWDAGSDVDEVEELLFEDTEPDAVVDGEASLSEVEGG